MRLAAAFIAFQLPVAAAQTEAVAEPPPLSAEWRMCIESNAAAVERLGEPIGAATEFLVSSVCAEPGERVRREQTLALAKANGERTRKMCEKMAEQAESEDERKMARQNCAYADVWSDGEDWSAFYVQTKYATPAATAFAAQRLLDLRTKRLIGTPQ